MLIINSMLKLTNQRQVKLANRVNYCLVAGNANYLKIFIFTTIGVNFTIYNVLFQGLLNYFGCLSRQYSSRFKMATQRLAYCRILICYLHWTTTFGMSFSGSSDTNHDSLL